MAEKYIIDTEDIIVTNHYIETNYGSKFQWAAAAIDREVEV